MVEDTEPTFVVDVSRRPMLVIIHGRANFLNCSPLKTFFRKMFDKGEREFLLDFSKCTGMDSTFLGILAGTALEARRETPQGEVQLAGLDQRNLELVNNLGLRRIVTIAEDNLKESDNTSTGLSGEVQTEEEKKEMLIESHEDLVKLDEANLNKFEDLLTFLKNED
jgi:anti-anti-sigma regulatory factor